MDILDKMTQIALDALWKIQIQECVDASKLLQVRPRGMTDEELIKEQTRAISEIKMEDFGTGVGTSSPNPQELPMPPPAWLV